jgi:hypothetical protein
MIVSKKNPLYLLISGIIFSIFGFLLIISVGNENEFLPVFGKLIGLGLIILGINQIIQYATLYQSSSFKIDIKNNYLIFEDKKYSLKNAYITTEFKNKDLSRVTLRIEKENNAKIIFNNVVFNTKELKKLLELIKPYLKHKDITDIEKNETFKLFKNGFSINNRYFYYDEIEEIKTTLINTSGSYFLDIEIFLKNGEIIDKRLTGGSDEYAKAIFAKLKHSGDILVDCKEDGKIGIYTILVIDIITGILIYFNDKFWILGGIMLFVSAFYFDYELDLSYELELCKKINKLFRADIEDIIGEIYDKKILK